MSAVVYMDICCLKRPFDDQRASRVQLETAAVAALIDQAERGQIRLVRSPAHIFENDRNPREDRRLATSIWLAAAEVVVPFSDTAAARGHELALLGFDTVDALHTAFAEAAGAKWLVTTDDRFLALASRHSGLLSTEVVNPIHLLDVQREGES